MDKKDFKIDFIGIGAKKCATTWIYECLKEHPQICMSVPKETNYFGFNYKKGLKWYESCFQYCEIDQVKGEFSPAYIIDLESVERIKKHNPSAKLIVSLRNPIERMYSIYLHNKDTGCCGFLSFSEFAKRSTGTNRSLIEMSLYYKYLKEFYSNFDKENILILIYEDIKKDPVGFIKKFMSSLK